MVLRYLPTKLGDLWWAVMLGFIIFSTMVRILGVCNHDHPRTIREVGFFLSQMIGSMMSIYCIYIYMEEQK